MTLEQKVDLIMRWIVANDDKEYAELSSQIRKAVTSGECDSIPSTITEPISVPDIRFDIEDILKELGVPAKVKGYEHLIEAVRLMYYDPSYRNCITKGLYGEIAKKFDTTESRVERTIRHAIEAAFDRGSLDAMMRIFGYSVSPSKARATNCEFICAVANELKRRL